MNDYQIMKAPNLIQIWSFQRLGFSNSQTTGSFRRGIRSAPKCWEL